MRKVAVIGVPSSAGARRTGQELAPRAFRRAGLLEGLRERGLQVVDFGDLPRVSFAPDPTSPNAQNLEFVTVVARRTADVVKRAAGEGAVPLVIGGDCTITLGVIAGLRESFGELGLLYFDADLDLNTPAESRTGIFDGMGMAHILGEGAPELVGLRGQGPLMRPERVALFGYNTEAGLTDPPELRRLEGYPALGKFPVSEVRGRAGPAARDALEFLGRGGAGVLVHFDVDVVDREELPAADVLHDGGLPLSGTMDALRVFVSAPDFRGLVITEFNAERDAGGEQAARLVSEVTAALGAGAPFWD